MARFEVLHNGVDDWKKGDIVTSEDLAEKGQKTEKRLVELGALRILDELEPQSQSDRMRNAVGDGIPNNPELTDEEKEALGAVENKEAASSGDKPSGESNLSGMTVPTLKQMAEGYGIEGTSGMNKAELITAIEKAQESPTA